MPFPFTCFCNKFKPCKTEYLGKYLLPQIDERRQQVAALLHPDIFPQKKSGIRSATFRLLLVLNFILFDAHFLSQCRYHAGVANNRFIGCLVGLLLLLFIVSFASRLPTRSNPLSATSKQNEQAKTCLFVLFGGSEGIRTPEPVKTTRFPIVPVMTTSIRFHITFLF